jgi:PTS system nitrogen regulatory IIA component
MRLTELLSADRVGIQREAGFQGTVAFVANGPGFDKARALSALAAMLAPAAHLRPEDVERVLAEREALQTTGIGDGVAIPHGAIAQLDNQCAALLLVPSGVDFDAIDGQKVTILFAVVGPKRATGEHLKTLARVSRLLRNKSFRDELVHAETPGAVFSLIAREEGA